MDPCVSSPAGGGSLLPPLGGSELVDLALVRLMGGLKDYVRSNLSTVAHVSDLKGATEFVAQYMSSWASSAALQHILASRGEAQHTGMTPPRVHTAEAGDRSVAISPMRVPQVGSQPDNVAGREVEPTAVAPHTHAGVSPPRGPAAVVAEASGVVKDRAIKSPSPSAVSPTGRRLRGSRSSQSPPLAPLTSPLCKSRMPTVPLLPAHLQQQILVASGSPPPSPTRTSSEAVMIENREVANSTSSGAAVTRSTTPRPVDASPHPCADDINATPPPTPGGGKREESAAKIVLQEPEAAPPLPRPAAAVHRSRVSPARGVMSSSSSSAPPQPLGQTRAATSISPSARPPTRSPRARQLGVLPTGKQSSRSPTLLSTAAVIEQMEGMEVAAESRAASSMHSASGLLDFVRETGDDQTLEVIFDAGDEPKRLSPAVRSKPVSAAGSQNRLSRQRGASVRMSGEAESSSALASPNHPSSPHYGQHLLDDSPIIFSGEVGDARKSQHAVHECQAAEKEDIEGPNNQGIRRSAIPPPKSTATTSVTEVLPSPPKSPPIASKGKVGSPQPKAAPASRGPSSAVINATDSKERTPESKGADSKGVVGTSLVPSTSATSRMTKGSTAGATAAEKELYQQIEMELENDIPKRDVENIKYLINALKPLSTEVLEEICYEWGNLPAHGRRARRKYRIRGDRRRKQAASKAHSQPRPKLASGMVDKSAAVDADFVLIDRDDEEEDSKRCMPPYDDTESDCLSSTTTTTTTDSFRLSQLSDFAANGIDMRTVSFSSLLDSSEESVGFARGRDRDFEDVDVIDSGSSDGEGVPRKAVVIIPQEGMGRIPTTAAERLKRRREARRIAQEKHMTKLEIRKKAKAKRERRDRRYFQEAIGQRIRFLAVNLLVTKCICFQRETGRKLLVSMDPSDSHEKQQIITDAEIDDMLFSVCHMLATDTRDSSLCVLASSFGIVNVTSVSRLPNFMPNLVVCMGLLALLQPLPQQLLQRILAELNLHAAQSALQASARESSSSRGRGGMTRTQQRAQESAAAQAALREARRIETSIEPITEEDLKKANSKPAAKKSNYDDNDDGFEDDEFPPLPISGPEEIADDFKERYCFPIATHVFPDVMRSPMMTDPKALPISSRLLVHESGPGSYTVNMASYVHTHFIDRQRLISDPFTCKFTPMWEPPPKRSSSTTTSSRDAAAGRRPAASNSVSNGGGSAAPSSSGVKGSTEKIKFRAECVMSGSAVSFRLFHRAPPLNAPKSAKKAASSSGRAQSPEPQQLAVADRRALRVVATLFTSLKTKRASQSAGPIYTTSKTAILFPGERLVFDDFLPSDAAGGSPSAAMAARGAEFYDVSGDQLLFKMNVEVLEDCTLSVAQNRLEISPEYSQAGDDDDDDDLPPLLVGSAGHTVANEVQGKLLAQLTQQGNIASSKGGGNAGGSSSSI